ncbi:hypothetical protein PV326_004169, partial [Microctonus aethiopoides]
MQVTAQQSFGIKPSNILGGPEQHASFSFIRPGLTQTSFSFNGPSSHQAFSSSIGNPQLAHRVLPNVANALSYRNPGLGYVTNGPIPTAYAPLQHLIGSQIATPQLSYNQLSLDQAMALGYLQHGQSDLYQNQLNQLLALRQTQSLQFPVHQSQPHLSTHQSQVQEQHHEHQQPQNLLGVAYSSAPAVTQFIIIAAFIAVAHAGGLATYDIGTASADDASVAYTQESTHKGFGGQNVISSFSKAVDSPYSSVRVSNNRVSNDGYYAQALAPTYAYAAHAP